MIYPLDGPMSTYIFSLKPGDVLEMKGPFKKYDYEANKEKHIGMIAGLFLPSSRIYLIFRRHGYHTDASSDSKDPRKPQR